VYYAYQGGTLVSHRLPTPPTEEPRPMEVQKVILLVEDNPDDEELTLRALSKINIANRVQVVRDGQEALDYFFAEGAESRPLPQLILLDLKLPKISGLEVLTQLRKEPRTRLIPTVILTSSRQDQDLYGGYDIGANSYICKPVDFVQFADAVAQLGLFWLVLNTTPPTRLLTDK